jgi:hypothetical protein
VLNAIQKKMLTTLGASREIAGDGFKVGAMFRSAIDSASVYFSFLVSGWGCYIVRSAHAQLRSCGWKVCTRFKSLTHEVLVCQWIMIFKYKVLQPNF